MRVHFKSKKIVYEWNEFDDAESAEILLYAQKHQLSLREATEEAMKFLPYDSINAVDSPSEVLYSQVYDNKDALYSEEAINQLINILQGKKLTIKDLIKMFGED